MTSRLDPFPTGPRLLDQQEDWDARFGRPGPLELEIGFGYGHFLLEYAAANPSKNLVGIEVKTKLVRGVVRQAERRELSNLIAFKADARRLLPTLFAAGSLSAVHVQFPDPWWKKRHHRRRLVDDELVTWLSRLVRPGGRVYLRTDILEYGRRMIEAFEGRDTGFRNVEGPEAFTADDGLGVPSNRERRYLASGTPVYRLVYER